MKVLISEGDWIYRERIVDLQNQVFGIQVLLEKPDALPVILKIKSSQPDAVIFGTDFVNGNIIDVIKNIHHLPFIHHMIILTTYKNSHFQKELLEFQVTYIPDTLLGFRKIIEILVGLQHNLTKLKNYQYEREEEEIVFTAKKKANPRQKIIWSRNPGERLLSRRH